MKYSVLMTVYKKDVAEYFDLALKSMINQTLKPNEIVLVKDGPISQELQNVIDKNKKSFKKITEVSLKENKGLGLALNAGLKVCKNNLVARMDSDDYSLPSRCELQVEEFKKDKDLDIIGCPVDEFVSDIENIVGCRDVPYDNESIYKYAKKRDPFNHPTVMYKKAKVIESGMYSDYRKNQDTDLWIKMLQNKAKCKNLKEHVFRFRFDEKTYEKRKSWTNTKILIGIRYKAWKSGFNGFFDFFQVTIIQLSMFILPVSFQKFIYQKVLRK